MWIIIIWFYVLIFWLHQEHRIVKIAYGYYFPCKFKQSLRHYYTWFWQYLGYIRLGYILILIPTSYAWVSSGGGLWPPPLARISKDCILLKTKLQIKNVLNTIESFLKIIWLSPPTISLEPPGHVTVATSEGTTSI